MNMTESPGRILVLDDESLIRMMARELLQALGYDSDLAADGGEAVSLYRHALDSGSPYCAVLVDLTICNGMGGLEAAMKIREMDSDAKLVVSSGFSEKGIVDRYEDYGFVAAMPKPYRLSDLRDVLDALCRKGG
jgi:CheY-like chemotaxis protein